MTSRTPRSLPEYLWNTWYCDLEACHDDSLGKTAVTRSKRRTSPGHLSLRCIPMQVSVDIRYQRQNQLIACSTPSLLPLPSTSGEAARGLLARQTNTTWQAGAVPPGECAFEARIAQAGQPPRMICTFLLRRMIPIGCSITGRLSRSGPSSEE